MEFISLTLVAVLIILVSLWLVSRKSTKKYLPGPTGLPIVGYLPFMTKKPYVKLTELSKTYGPAYSVRFGSIDIAVLTSFETIKEAFMKDSLIGRPLDLPFAICKETVKTESFTGMPWKEQRQFSLQMLRDLGLGKTRMEEHLKEEILELTERLSENVEKPTLLSPILTPSMSNNIASLVFGKRLKYNDPERQNLDRLVGEIGRLVGTVAWQIFFPWIRNVMYVLNVGNSKKSFQVLKELTKYTRNEIERHEATLDPNNIRDFVDGYLLEIQKNSNEPNSAFNKGALSDISRTLFATGSESVRITVEWMMLISAAYPEVQKKIQAEIDEVLGADRFPTGQDRMRMPFTEAAISELMRWRTLVPMNVLRCTLQDTELNGYFIPKRSRVLAVLWSIDHDEKLWGKDVNEYKPERFLSEDGQKCVKPEYFIPFSIGKRSCPGKSLAEIQVFLYVAAILQKFEVTAPPGKEIDLEGVLGISLKPKKQELCLKLRH